MERVCKYCGKEKPIDEFYKNKKSKDGYLWKCKECFNKYFETYERKKYPYKSKWNPAIHHGRPIGTNRSIKKYKKTGIYKIQSKLFPNKIYIGSSKNIKKRWSIHLNDLKYQAHRNYKLNFHIKKYGIKDLSFSILKICKPEHLIYWEQYFISELKPFFNIHKFASEPGSKSNEARKYAFQDEEMCIILFNKEAQILNQYKEELIPLNIL